MESSSENSFAWTDTSSDSLNSISMAADDKDNSDENYTVHDEKKTKDKKSRKKHNDESANLEPEIVDNEEQTYFDTKSNSSVKKEKIKIEPDSENDFHKKKKKIKHLETNGNQNDSHESYDETYLDIQVKQELSSASSSTKHKQKKRKRSSSIDSSTIASKSHKKKKKKSKKLYDSDNDNLDIEVKMDIGETVVNKQEQTHCKNSTDNHTDSSVTENTTLQEESEESGCDEISAIKYDDSHSLHSTSFTNKSIEDENTKVNCNDGSNIITKLAGKILQQNSDGKLEAAKHRKQRISDRIRFEDDDDDLNTGSSHVEYESHSENNNKPLKFKQFHKTNPNLKLLPKTFNNTEFTRDDEIWILKCPKEINILDFNNTTLNIHGKCKIKVGGQTYEGSAEEQQSDIISLLTMEHSKYKIMSVPPSGTINLRKRIPKAHFRDDNIMVNNQTNFIPLPETKCRHPLFGSNYKKALKIPAAIAERLNVQDSEDPLMRTEKKKKKKKKNEKKTSDQDEIMMKTEPEVSVEIREKKKKKRKIIDDEGPVSKKVKRIKHDPESAEAWGSEKAIEENLFNF